jgi:hypothetical protein
MAGDRVHISKPFISSSAIFAMAKISDEMYERLQQILEKQNGHAYTFEETNKLAMGS